jgi:hypothetical protein
VRQLLDEDDDDNDDDTKTRGATREIPLTI